MDTGKTPNDTLYKQLAIWTFSGFGLYFRDTTLSSELQSHYKVGQYFRNGFFLDVSTRAQGIAGNTRFLIISAHTVSMSVLNPAREELKQWGAHVINANSYFKVLDIQRDDTAVQITLLHVPYKWAVLGDLNGITAKHEELAIEKAVQLYEKLKDRVPDPIILAREWVDRTQFAVGLTARDEFFDPAFDPNLVGLPFYKALTTIGDDTSRLNTP